MRQTALLFIFILCTACGTQPAIPASAPTQSSAPTNITTTTDLPAPTVTSSPAPTDTPAPTPTSPPPPRWFWAVTDNEILAFNANGEVNSVLDFSGIQLSNNDNPPIRISDERAVLFLGNNNNPKAFVLTSDSAIPINMPNVRAPIPQNGWTVEAQHDPYIIFMPTGTVTAPAILINGGTGEASLLAANVFGPTEISYLIHFSADGKSVRYATGEGPVKVYNRDLQTGSSTVILESGTSVLTNATGELWYDIRNNTVITADGAAITLTNTDGNIRNILLNDGWILAAPRDCDADCPLQVYSATRTELPLNYTLPMKLTKQVVVVSFGKLLARDRLIVGVFDYGSNAYHSTLWLLSPDGKSKILGAGVGLSLNDFPGLSPDGRYLLVTEANDPSAYTLYDLTTDQAIFSQTTGSPDLFLDVAYFAEGALILEQTAVNHLWVYNFAAGSAYEITAPSDYEYCTTLSPDGKPICIAEDGVAMYDPISENRTLLINEPVSNLSN